MWLQVRNTASCMKVAVDFLSPHAMRLCMHMAREIRGDQDRAADMREWYRWASNADLDNPGTVHFKEDTLGTETILVHAAYELLQAEEAAARGAGGTAEDSDSEACLRA